MVSHLHVRRGGAGLVLALTMATALAGCGSGSSSTAKQSPTSTAGQQSPTSAAAKQSSTSAAGPSATTGPASSAAKQPSQAAPPITTKSLSYWSSWSVGEPQQKIFSSMITDFTKATGIKVDVRWLGRDYPNAVKNAAAIGKAPDVYDDATDHIADFRTHHVIGDLSGVLTKTIPGEGKTVKDVLPDSVLKASSDAGGLGMIPYTLISSGIWFNAATHPEWVANPPATYDDFLATAAKIKATGRAPIAQDGTINGYNAYWIYWLLMRHGGPGSLAALGGNAAAWDKPAVLAAAQDVEKLVKAGLFEPDYMGTKFPAAQTAWASGKHDLIVNGTWLASETKPFQTSGFNAQMFQFPSVTGGSDSVEVGALGWSINPKSPNLAAAQTFLAFGMQKTYMSRISTEALNMSPRADVAPPPSLVAAQKAIVNAKSVQQTDDAAPGQYPGWWNDVFLPLDDKLIAGKITAAQFVSQGKSQTSSYVK